MLHIKTDVCSSNFKRRPWCLAAQIALNSYTRKIKVCCVQLCRMLLPGLYITKFTIVTPMDLMIPYNYVNCILTESKQYL